MKRIFIIHRWSGGPGDDWRPWLKEQLEAEGFEVVVPEMPDTDEPNVEKWVAYLQNLVGAPDAETFFVGHSIGCQAILRYLETLSAPVGGAVFVAGWFNLENLEDEETRSLARPWIENPVDPEKIKKVLSKSTLIISSNDPYGCHNENSEKFKALGSEVLELENAGHITQDDGFTKLPQALEVLEKYAQEKRV